MNKFQRKASRAAKREQRVLYSNYKELFNINNLNECITTKPSVVKDFVEVVFTNNGTKFLNAVGTIPSYYSLKKKYNKLLNE